jgi:3-hydroxybutyryl-CoA dehydrogenase
MTIPEIQKICFVGAGTMGAYNALVAALAGYQATIFDLSEKALAQVPEVQIEVGAFLSDAGFCDADALIRAAAHISIATNLEVATADADLVSESIFEHLDAKRALHQKLDVTCPPHTIITTNTSSLRVSEIEDAVTRRELFAALHSHLGSPLVDIVGGSRTSASTLDILHRYTLSIGGVPLLLKKEHPGYVLNAMLGPLLSTAILMTSHGSAAFEDVDRAWMHFRNAPMGPFGMVDLFGIKLIHDSWTYRDVEAQSASNRTKILEQLKPYMDANTLGRKSGAGFYHYPEPAYQTGAFLDTASSLSALHSILAVVVITNAIHLATLDVAQPAQIDMAWKVGTYLDAGPFEMLSNMGTEQFEMDLHKAKSSGFIDNPRYESAKTYLLTGNTGNTDKQL